VLDFVINSRTRDIGGFQVKRLLPASRQRMIGPFIFLDHMGPLTIARGASADILPHPHIGLSTVTYLFEGANVHRDSLGTRQIVRAGDLNIMTAGRGIVHSERHDREAPEMTFHGVQIWVALPEANEDDAPSFAHHPAGTLPELAEPGVRGRLLIGSAYGVTSPIEHPSRPLMIDLAIDRAGCIDLPTAIEQRGVYVASGRVRIGETEVAADQLAVLRPGATRLEGVDPARVVVIGGPAMGKRLIDWNFVASTQDRIDRARQAWLDQTFPKIPGDDQEFVPLPR